MSADDAFEKLQRRAHYAEQARLANNDLDRVVDLAIARENANPQGLPPEDIAALDVPYHPLEEESRTYNVFLPVTITVHPDQTVIAEVDLSEADDNIRSGGPYPLATVVRDATIIQNSVIQARVEVK